MQSLQLIQDLFKTLTSSNYLLFNKNDNRVILNKTGKPTDPVKFI